MLPALASGTGIGLLIGSLIGLSVSPVVGTVVGALAALLAAFLGLTDQQLIKSGEAPSAAVRRTREYRAAAFGFSCIAGVVLGLVVRTHNYLGESLSDQFNNLQAIGLTVDQARALVVYREYGVLPEGLQAREPEAPATPQEDGVLYSALSEQCALLNPERYGNNMDETLSAWRLQNDAQLTNLANLIAGLAADEDRRDLVDAIWSMECAEQ